MSRIKMDLRNCDCKDLMKEFPDKYFQLAIVDPPYGLDERLTSGGPLLQKRAMTALYKGKKWDSLPDASYFQELQRVSQAQIIWGGVNYFPLPPTRCSVVWDKIQPWENFSQVEIAWTSFDSPAKLFRYDNRTGDKIHPTQKPVVLYRWLLDRFANKGDRILDTHLGSMSIVIACFEMGFDITGSEIDEDYFVAGLDRVNKSTEFRQINLADL